IGCRDSPRPWSRRPLPLFSAFRARVLRSFYFTERGVQMSKFRSARAVLAVAAGVALAGCSASASSSVAVSSGTSSSASAKPTPTEDDAFFFYSNGTIGYPVTGGEVSVLSPGVLWPSAAGLASGRAFRSVLRVKVNKTGPAQDANVTVQGQGTHTVTVPAGTYQATLVTMIMSVRVGGFGSDEEIETWVAPGTGPVKSQVFLLAGGRSKLTTTEELLTFTKG